MPELYIDKQVELILYFPSMPSAMLEVPIIIAERLIAGGWFRVIHMAKAACSWRN